MTSTATAPSKPHAFTPLQHNPHFRAAVARGVKQILRHQGLRVIPVKTETNGRWKPRMDLVDDPSCPNVMAIFELPGVKNENITLQIKDRRLVVAGNRAAPPSEALEATVSSASGAQAQPLQSTNRAQNAPPVHSNSARISTRAPNADPSSAQPIRELRYGPFYRTIAIPDGIKQSEVTAGIQDGMLTVTWPRVPAAVRQPVMSAGARSANTDSKSGKSVAYNAVRSPHPTGSNDITPMLQ